MGLEKNKQKIVIANVDIEDQARDIAEEKMLSSKEELKGVRGFLRKIWTHNLAREYYRQKEISKARREIQQSGNLYAGEKGEKTDHENAMNAIVERFQAEYEDENLLRKGEEKKTLDEKQSGEAGLKKSIQDLMKRFASGTITEEQFKLEKNNLFDNNLTGPENKKSSRKDASISIYADNLLEIAKQVKDSIAHGKGLDALDEDFEIIVGKARAGVESEAQYNAVDRITEKIQKSFVGRFANEATVAAAVAIAYGFLAKGAVNAAHRGAKLVGPFGMGLSAGIGGVVAGIRENKRVKEERAQHAREMAKGKQIESGSKRREEMEKFRYGTKGANELSGNLREALEGLKTQPSEQKLQTVIEHLNEINSRITFSEQERIDLVSFSDSKNVEKERTSMYIAAAEAKVYLKKNIHADWATAYNNEQQLNEYLQQTKEEKIRNKFLGEKTLKDEAFIKMKRGKVAWAVAKGLGIGLVVGTVAQEAGAVLSRNGNEGVFSGATSNGLGHRYTALAYLRHLFAGDLPHDEISQHLPHNVAPPVLPAHEIPQNLPHNEAFPGPPIHEFSSHEAVVSTKDFVKDHEQLFSKIKRGAWGDNNTPRPDRNELKLWWGGNNGTGIDKNGNYVFNIKHMTRGGSFHGGKHWDPQKLMKAGKMKMLLSLSGDTQNQVIEIPIDANGNAIIDPNSEIGKIAFANAGGKAKFLGKFAEVAVVGEKTNGAAHVNVLATHVGKGINSLKTIVTEERIIPQAQAPLPIPEVQIPSAPIPEAPIPEMPIIKPAGYDIELPYVIPISGRKPLERLGRKTGTAKEIVPGVVTSEQKETNEKVIAMLLALKRAKEQIEKEKENAERKDGPARAAAWHTIYKLENSPDLEYKDLNAGTPEERDQKFLDLTRKLWTELTVHERPDMDANSCLKLMELAGINVDMSKVNLVPKGNTADNGIIMDTSERHGVISEEGGRKLIIDHHGKESDRSTSATKFVYETLLEMGLLRKEEYLDKYVEFVTKLDNLDLAPNEKDIYSNYYENLYGLAGKMKVDDVLEFIKQGADPKASLPADFLKSHTYFNPGNGKEDTLAQYAAFLKNQMGFGEKEVENMEKSGFALDTGNDRFGKVLIDIKKKTGKDKWQNKVNGIDSSRQLTAFAKGFGAYIVWSPDEKKFFVYTKKKMDEKSVPGGFSQGKNIRGHMLVSGTDNAEEVKPEFLQEILAKLSGKADFKIEGKLKKAMDLDMAGKEMLDLLDEGNLTEDVLRKKAQDSNVPLRTLLVEMMLQRIEINKKFHKKFNEIKKMPPAKAKSIDVNKIAIDLFLDDQKRKAATQPAPIEQTPPPANPPDAAKEKQEKMSDSVKKLSGLFSTFELSYDAIKEEAKRINVEPSELAVGFVQNDKELNSQFEAKTGSMEAEKLAITIILEDEKGKIEEKIGNEGESDILRIRLRRIKANLLEIRVMMN
jgi:hypothetical protein